MENIQEIISNEQVQITFDFTEIQPNKKRRICSESNQTSQEYQSNQSNQSIHLSQSNHSNESSQLSQIIYTNYADSNNVYDDFTSVNYDGSDNRFIINNENNICYQSNQTND